MVAIVRYQTPPSVFRDMLNAAGLLDEYRKEADTWLLSAKRHHRHWLRSVCQGKPDWQAKADRNGYLSLLRAMR